MPFSDSCQKIIILSMTLIVVVVICFIGAVWGTHDYYKFKVEARQLKEQFVEQQKDIARREVKRITEYIDFRRLRTELDLKDNLKSRVNEAIVIAENIYLALVDTHSEEEIKVLVREALRAVRFNGGRGYYLIFDLDGNSILNPNSPLSEGGNLLDLQDRDGLYVIKRSVQIIKKDGEGFLNWLWYKPGNREEVSEKIGFVKKFSRFDWFIGTGEYLENYTDFVQKETLDWINQVRYGQDGYIYVYDFNGKVLAHYKQVNLGINKWHFRDANNVPVIQELIKAAKNKDEVFLEYVGTLRPSTGTLAPKIGYAVGVQDWQWVVGTGLYLDTVDEMIASKKEVVIGTIVCNTLFLAAIFLLSLIPIFLVSRYIATLMSQDVSLFSNCLNQSGSGESMVRIKDISFSEFKVLADSVNAETERQKQVSEQIEKLKQRIQHRKKIEALGILAGGVAHDLNNILSGMIGYPDLILNSLPSDSPQRNFLISIKESGQKATDIVEDLLTLIRRSVAQRRVLDLNNLIQKFLRSPEFTRVIELYPDFNVELKLTPDLMKIKGSQVHLQKTVLNLIRNAAGAQTEGVNITLITSNCYVDKKLSRYQDIEEGEYVTLEVIDDGTSLAPEDLKHIFEPFYVKKKLGRSGTGLGMAVVWGTVQDHEGFIDVITSEDKGVVFKLYFKATRENFLEEITPLIQSNYMGTGQNILIVDDIMEQRELAGAMLEGLGYQVAAVDCGEAAVSYLKNNPMDLVVLDMVLENPNMDGLETYKEILKVSPGQKAVIVSGYAETDRVKAALLLGVGQYIKKPYTIEKIGSAIKQILES